MNSGIRIGLKTLTVLFIGGASGSAQLLGCQRTDGAGERCCGRFKYGSFQAFIPHRFICSARCIFSGAALKEFAFRPLFPHERCDEALWVWNPTFTNSLCLQNLYLLFSHLLRWIGSAGPPLFATASSSPASWDFYLPSKMWSCER